jgi:hypothetical protein
MKKQNLILTATLAAVFSASKAFAEAEVTGKIVHESAKFTTSGTTIGAAAAHGKDVMKTETSARIYIDGEADAMQEGATYHVELNLMRDSKGIGKYDSNESYTQRDALREAYVDTTVDDWSIRAGKQQVVWGTADGMKLLDMINPTDYSEMAQNQMEDSRIPVWMVNAETDLAQGGNFQVVVSQPRENIFAGMNRNINTSQRVNAANGTDLTTSGHDQGNAFIMKGVDSITGKTSGFLNGVPDLGSIAAGFEGVFTGANLINAGAAGHTVGSFTALTAAQTSGFDAMATGGNAAAFTNMSGTYDGTQILSGFSTPYDFNLVNATTKDNWDASSADSMFEYMDRTSFASFAAYSGAGSKYRYNMPSDGDANVALKYKNNTSEGLNYSLNLSNNYDSNPVINIGWESSTGKKLTVNKTATGTGAADSQVITLSDADGGCYGAVTAACAASAGAGVLVFEETLERATNIGGSFDMAIESKELGPVVLRGEALYQKGVYSPVFDRGMLAIGDLVGALKMTEGDRFKYVLGADITVMTNMMVSAQFIQDRNLDHVDSNVDYDGTACSAADGTNCGVYTADFATMHMSNNFNKAEENKEFYSLFFSKPFGASGEHRWNNITMYEENGGKGNRLDAEFSIDDDTQATVEYNKYWGNENTQFGQLEKSSNIQVGVKYSF